MKSFNFLIDSQLNSKIADLDLGMEVRPVSERLGGSLSAEKHEALVGAPTGGSSTAVGGSDMCINWQAPEVYD